MVELGFTSTFDDYMYCSANTFGTQKENKLYQFPRTKNIEHNLFGNLNRGFSNTDQHPSFIDGTGLNLHLSELILKEVLQAWAGIKNKNPGPQVILKEIYVCNNSEKPNNEVSL